MAHRMPDAINVIRRNRLLSVASKEEDIGFYIYQQGPRKGSMSGNDKIIVARETMQEARKEREREKKARCRSDEVAGQSSGYDLSEDPHSDEDDTEVEAGDDGDDEMHDHRDPRDMHMKEEEVTVSISRHILNAPAVQVVAG